MAEADGSELLMAGKLLSTGEMEAMVLQIRNEAAQATLAPPNYRHATCPFETEESRKRVSFGVSGLSFGHAAVSTVLGDTTGGPGGAVEGVLEMHVPIGGEALLL